MTYRYHVVGKLPPENESWVFVFSSNLSGVHGVGAALVAKNKYGAIQFIAEGLVGASYAIPTKDKRITTMPLSIVYGYAQTFKEFTLKNKDLNFWVTSIGCGLAGYNPRDVAPMFKGCGTNCSFQEDWRPYLEEVLEDKMIKRIYAGIGSRKTPQSHLNEFRELGRRFGTEGYTLRSGGADGADIAFEEGCDDVNGKKEIWMPWPFFNRNNSRVFPDTRHFKIASDINSHWPYFPEKTSGTQVTGIDLGLTSLLTLSDGTKVSNPKHYIKAQRKLRRLQQALSRKTQGSRNRTKAKTQVAAHHAHIHNARLDQLHKLSRTLVNDNQVIGVESLVVRNLVRNSKLSKHISDASWRTLLSQLVYKAQESQHCTVVMAHQYYPSSHLCSTTGKALGRKLDLSERDWQCPHCHQTHDRDINAAKNLAKEALRAISKAQPGCYAGKLLIADDQWATQ